MGGRGLLRFELLMDQVRTALPPPPARVVDAGGGTGQVAVPLAGLGYEVTVVDTSPAMLATCAERAAEEGGATLALVQGDAAEVAALLGPASQDAVLCHDLLGDVAEPAGLLAALGEVLHPGGVLSLTFLNRDWLTLRAGRRGDFAEALRLLEQDRGRIAAEVLPWLDQAGFEQVEVLGVGVFAAGASDDLDRAALAGLAELERRVAGREPYRSSAHTLHLIGRRQTPLSQVG
ncbi:MAG TPA: methyltransferase domain-containing protein [Actinomycetes bacterium]